MWQSNTTGQSTAGGGGEFLALHWDLTAAEREVMRLRAQGTADAAIMEALDLTFPALRSRLRRFADRTGLTHYELVAWCATHVECCVEAEGA